MNIKYYQNKINDNSQTLESLKNKIRPMPILKLFFFAAATFFIVSPFVWGWIKLPNFLISGTMWIVFFILHYKDVKYCNQRDAILAINQVYSNEIGYFNNDFSALYNGKRFIDNSHEYSFDLDVFGEKSLFHRLNRTVSYEANSILAEKLKTIPNNTDEVIERQKALQELAKKDNFRHYFLAICNGFGRQKSDYNRLKNHQSTALTGNLSLTLMIISISLTFTLILLSALNIVPWSFPALFFVLQMFAPMFLFRKINKASREVGWLHKNFKQYAQLIQLIQEQDFESEENKSLKNKLLFPLNALDAFKQLSSILEKFDQRNNSYALIVLNGLFLRDFFLLRTYNKWCLAYKNHIQQWVLDLAEMESRISLATFVFNHPDYVSPEVTDNQDILIKTTNVGHPFISADKLVGNDFTIHKNKFSIITGANMSGKSTFLRTIGVNYILALNGVKVCAEKFQFSLFHLFSSMRNADDLTLGISYFNAELIRIKQLIQFVKSKNHTLIILDEILKGTNSKDKLAGSIIFLKEMEKLPTTGIIATHDLELSNLENEKPEIYENYCFEINLAETIDYSYKIEKGISKNLNATYLLKKILEN
ncbi:MAG TPA: DNA mismatch repair protein MutS [Bacteroidales bacterium]|nr:DNA mismatch repair protein MutS [Bacteroidales bacterium]